MHKYIGTSPHKSIGTYVHRGDNAGAVLESALRVNVGGCNVSECSGSAGGRSAGRGAPTSSHIEDFPALAGAALEDDV